MKRLIFALLLIAAPAMAQNCTTTQLGQFTFGHCDDGSSFNAQQLGRFRFDHFTPPPRPYPTQPVYPQQNFGWPSPQQNFGWPR